MIKLTSGEFRFWEHLNGLKEHVEFNEKDMDRNSIIFEGYSGMSDHHIHPFDKKILCKKFKKAYGVDVYDHIDGAINYEENRNNIYEMFNEGKLIDAFHEDFEPSI
ncbi:MAG: hypothetical protein V1663_01225, partial [archaeon]